MQKKHEVFNCEAARMDIGKSTSGLSGLPLSGNLSSGGGFSVPSAQPVLMANAAAAFDFGGGLSILVRNGAPVLEGASANSIHVLKSFLSNPLNFARLAKWAAMTLPSIGWEIGSFISAQIDHLRGISSNTQAATVTDALRHGANPQFYNSPSSTVRRSTPAATRPVVPHKKSAANTAPVVYSPPAAPVVRQVPLALTRGGQTYRLTIESTEASSGSKSYVLQYKINGATQRFSLSATDIQAASQEATQAFNQGRLPGLKVAPHNTVIDSPLSLRSSGHVYNVIIRCKQSSEGRKTYSVAYTIGGHNHAISLSEVSSLSAASKKAANLFHAGRLPGLTGSRPSVAQNSQIAIAIPNKRGIIDIPRDKKAPGLPGAPFVPSPNVTPKTDVDHSSVVDVAQPPLPKGNNGNRSNKPQKPQKPQRDLLQTHRTPLTVKETVQAYGKSAIRAAVTVGVGQQVLNGAIKTGIGIVQHNIKEERTSHLTEANLHTEFGLLLKTPDQYLAGNYHTSLFGKKRPFAGYNFDGHLMEVTNADGSLSYSRRIPRDMYEMLLKNPNELSLKNGKLYVTENIVDSNGQQRNVSVEILPPRDGFSQFKNPRWEFQKYKNPNGPGFAVRFKLSLGEQDGIGSSLSGTLNILNPYNRTEKANTQLILSLQSLTQKPGLSLRQQWDTLHTNGSINFHSLEMDRTNVRDLTNRNNPLNKMLVVVNGSRLYSDGGNRSRDQFGINAKQNLDTIRRSMTTAQFDAYLRENGFLEIGGAADILRIQGETPEGKPLLFVFGLWNELQSYIGGDFTAEGFRKNQLAPNIGPAAYIISTGIPQISSIIPGLQDAREHVFHRPKGQGIQFEQPNKGKLADPVYAMFKPDQEHAYSYGGNIKFQTGTAGRKRVIKLYNGQYYNLPSNLTNIADIQEWVKQNIDKTPRPFVSQNQRTYSVDGLQFEIGVRDHVRTIKLTNGKTYKIPSLYKEDEEVIEWIKRAVKLEYINLNK